ncbi:MAG: 50S ribosomal protein L12 [Candidatus Pacearchaeota archaeon]|nr:50S ribosomal protein L12 [Candidatus Pacearchaeota archaeon]
MEYIYAVLLLHELGKEINEENLKKVIEATGCNADESKIKSIITSLKEIDIKKVISEAPTIQAPTKQQPEEKEEKKEKAEEAVEGLAALFG